MKRLACHPLSMLFLAACLLSAWSQTAIGAEPVLGIVDGHVVLNGKPIATGTIELRFPDGQLAGGIIKEGKYRLERVPVGNAKVSIESEGIPKKYSSPEHSGLTCEVKAGMNTFDIQLVDNCSHPTSLVASLGDEPLRS